MDFAWTHCTLRPQCSVFHPNSCRAGQFAVTALQSKKKKKIFFGWPACCRHVGQASTAPRFWRSVPHKARWQRSRETPAPHRRRANLSRRWPRAGCYEESPGPAQCLGMLGSQKTDSLHFSFQYLCGCFPSTGSANIQFDFNCQMHPNALHNLVMGLLWSYGCSSVFWVLLLVYTKDWSPSCAMPRFGRSKSSSQDQSGWTWQPLWCQS